MTYNSVEGIAAIVIVSLACVSAAIFEYLWLKTRHELKKWKDKYGSPESIPPKKNK